MHNTVSQRFCDYELNVFSRNVKLLSDVFQRNFAVSNGNSSQSDSDNDLIQPQNDIVKLVSLECIFVLLNNIVEILQLAFKHDLNQLVVRVCVLKVKIISENLSVRNFAL
jgi:hypothetical protein